MRKFFLGFTLLFVCSLLNSCLTSASKQDNCEVVEITVINITEGSVKDIVSYNEGIDKWYYINRGLEQGLLLEDLKTKVLNKTVTLHLAKVLGGRTSNHIAQTALDDEIIYTEFN